MEGIGEVGFFDAQDHDDHLPGAGRELIELPEGSISRCFVLSAAAATVAGPMAAPV